MHSTRSLPQWLFASLCVSLSSGLVIRQDAPQLPQELPHWNETNDSINATCAADIKARNETFTALLSSVTVETATFENTVKPWALGRNKFLDFFSKLNVYYNFISSDMDSLFTCQDAQNDFMNGVYLNKQYYALVKKVQDDFDNNRTTLDYDDQAFLQTLFLNFNSSGIDLPSDVADKVNNLTNEIFDLEDQFSANMAASTAGVWFTKEELDGVPEGIFSTLTPGNQTNTTGKYFLPATDDQLIYKLRESLTNATSRELYVIASVNGAPDNIKVLGDIITKRDELARLQGYDNYAQYKIESQMAKSPTQVKNFFDTLSQKLSAPQDEQIKELKAIEKTFTGNDQYIFQWDQEFYEKQSTEEQFKYKDDDLTEYFSAIPTLEKLVAFYGNLYQLKIDRVPLSNDSDLVWNPDVQLHTVYDASGSNEFMGYLYLDIYQRPGKQGSAFMVSSDNGYVDEDGKRHYPTAALATNYVKSGGGQPTLLSRDDLAALMHELGHTMHQISSKVKYADLHGPLSTPSDFMEAPSQLMENFAWLPQILTTLGSHWSYESPEAAALWQKQNPNKTRPAEQMSDDMANRVHESKNAFTAVGQQEQIAYLTYDQKIHTPATHDDAEKIDTTLLWNSNYKDITHMNDGEDIGLGPRWGHKATTFAHLATENYGACYYSYLWSYVYAMDVMYTAGFDKNPFNSEQGLRWRQIVLSKGGSRDYFEILKEFLGHEPNQEGFYRAILSSF